MLLIVPFKKIISACDTVMTVPAGQSETVSVTCPAMFWPKSYTYSPREGVRI